MYRDNETAPFVTKNLAVNLSNYLVNIYLLFNIPRKSETYYQIIMSKKSYQSNIRINQKLYFDLLINPFKAEKNKWETDKKTNLKNGK